MRLRPGQRKVIGINLHLVLSQRFFAAHVPNSLKPPSMYAAIQFVAVSGNRDNQGLF